MLDNGWMYHTTVEERECVLEAKLKFTAPNKDYCQPILFWAKSKEKQIESA
jgi:hypothetical protein